MPEDLKRVRSITQGHPVIIAAPTFDGILATLGKPLPDRTNIVIRPSQPIPDGCHEVATLEEGLELATSLDKDEVFVMGDERLYTEVFPQVSKLYLTVVGGEHPTTERFPDFSDFKLVSEELGESGGYMYAHKVLEREVLT